MRIVRLACAALFAATAGTSIVATQAAHSGKAGSTSGPLSDTAQAASAQGYGYARPGHYHWRGRYYEHRRWHPGYYTPSHRWHRGVWIYF